MKGLAPDGAGTKRLWWSRDAVTYYWYAPCGGYRESL